MPTKDKTGNEANVCKWEFVERKGRWATGCGDKATPKGRPTAGEWEFCPMCGREIEWGESGWAGVDWRMSDSQIAEELGVSRQRVNQKRHSLGEPLALTTEERLVRMDTSKYTAKQLAGMLEVTPSRVYSLTKALGLPYKASKTRGGPPFKYDWDSVDWEEPNAIIAEKLGSHPQLVARMRSRLRSEGRKDVPVSPRSRLGRWSRA